MENGKLRRLKAGDRDAVGWFIDRYAGYVCAVLRAVLGPEALQGDLEELCSDVFLTLWRNADRVEPGRVKSWLAAVARRKALEARRKRPPEEPLEEDFAIVAPDDPEREVEAAELRDLVIRAVLAMPEPERSIFLRHYYYGQTLAAIAGDLDLNLSTVKTKLRRGRAKLKEELMKEGLSYEDQDF